MQNTWRIQYYIGRAHVRKWIAALVFFPPFPGSMRNQQRGVESVKSKRKPWSLRPLVMGSHIYKQFLFPWTHFCCSISSIPKDPQWGKQAIKEALMYAQARPTSFQTGISPCLPKFNPDSEFEFSPPAPTPALAGGHFRKTPGKASPSTFPTGSTRWIFTLAKIWVQNDGQKCCWPSWDLLEGKQQETWFLQLNTLCVSDFPYLLPSPKTNSCKREDKNTLNCSLYFMKRLPWRKSFWTNETDH